MPKFNLSQSYTTYVAATIHVRNAAQRGSQSEAGNLLSICLEGLKENSLTNTGVSKMYDIIRGLMRKLGVVLPHLLPEGNHLQGDEHPHNCKGKAD